MKYTYKTQGTCSRQIDIAMNGDVIDSVAFHGGCNGNLKGISTLIPGMTAAQVIERFEGIKCGLRTTSCPDQLAQALKAMQEEIGMTDQTATESKEVL